MGECRARVGITVNSLNVVTEPYLNASLPRDVHLVADRISFAGAADVSALRRSGESAFASAKLLADAHPDLLVYACTSASFVSGGSFDADLTRKIEDATGIPAVTAANCVIQAMRSLNARKICTLSPYLDEVDEHEQAYLQGCGFEVVSHLNLGIADGDDMYAVPPSDIVEYALRAWVPAADCLFISCLQFRAHEAIHEIEARILKPVVTSGQVILWSILSKLDPASVAKTAQGRLFSRLDIPS